MKKCANCYWQMSGCIQDEEPEHCWCYLPANFDENWEPPEEKEYDPGPSADRWGRDGYTVISIYEEGDG